MKDKTEHLNDRQAEAVAHIRGPALVLAGAGSGKTRVITTRMVRLIESGVPPWAIFCVTFTNKAAAEMRNRIASSLGMDVNDLWISTFHSACLRILKSEYKNLGYKSMPVIFDDTDQRSLIRSIVKENGYTDAQVPHRRVLGLISKFKNNIKNPDQMGADRSVPDAALMAELFRLYEQRLLQNNAVDFDDLLLLVIRLFEGSPEILERYSKKFRYLMVDEFQDTNLVQYRILKLLASTHKNIFAVGDDDQSIYRWRGARIGNLYGFEDDFPGCVIYKLEQNYRSTGNILKAANSVVEPVDGRKKKTLWTKQDAGPPITIQTCIDEKDEADFIADEIREAVSDRKALYGDFAVFYRTNAQSRIVEEVFNQISIPYRIYGGLKFYARKEIKDIMAYFRLALNERDEMSFVRAVSSPPRGIGAVTVGGIRNFARQQGISILAACSGDNNGATKAANMKLARFAALITELKNSAGEISARELIGTAIEKSGYLAALIGKQTAQDNSRAENLKELVSAPGKDETIADFLERTALMSEQDKVEQTSDAALLMTLHISKGLEFPTVFMVGMEENLFPHANSKGSREEEDEERRLCYVGMTRARNKLYLIHARRRSIFGSTHNNEPSAFLEDIPPDVVENSKPGFFIRPNIGGKPPRRPVARWK
ncbi:MAG: DNA helicase [bacterium]|nr:MAG: DNA helicase [bacterium]